MVRCVTRYIARLSLKRTGWRPGRSPRLPAQSGTPTNNLAAKAILCGKRDGLVRRKSAICKILVTGSAEPGALRLVLLGLGLRGPSILSILFAASWEAVGPRKGRSPLTGNFSAT